MDKIDDITIPKALMLLELGQYAVAENILLEAIGKCGEKEELSPYRRKRNFLENCLGNVLDIKNESEN